MIIRTSNKESIELIRDLRTFRGSNFYGVQKTQDMFVVYSYGTHWPLAVYSFKARHWWVNITRRSVSTTRHLSLVRRAVSGFEHTECAHVDVCNLTFYGVDGYIKYRLEAAVGVAA